MLKVLELSFIGALICTLIIGGIGVIIRRDWEKIRKRLVYILVTFIIEFLWMYLVLCFSNKSLTLITVLIWMWPALLLDLIIDLIVKSYYKDFGDYVTIIALIIISIVARLASLLGPVQNLIYVYDMSETDISYAITSDEVLAKLELTIDNSNNFEKKYFVDSPEMRKVNGEDIAVYRIKNNSEQNEYIPGYFIQRSGKLPEIVNKRIYFDTSFFTSVFDKRDSLTTIRRKYPTVIIGDHKFDLDDDYNPYEIFEYREHLFSSNGKDYGIIVLNLMDGTSEKYTVDKIPAWIDFTTTYSR